MVSLPGLISYESDANLNADSGHKYKFFRESDINAWTVYFNDLAMEDSAEPEPEIYCDTNGNILAPEDLTNNSTLVSAGRDD